jgi:carbonic anhydrase
MDHVKPLPGYLVQRYQGWKATTYSENKGWYRRLAEEGQRPRAMVISCCDSRVHVTSEPDGDHHGTSAAVEYAVSVLKVTHLMVLGHSQCGGVKGCIDMCKGHAPELDGKESFVGRWMDILRPKYDLVSGIDNSTEQERALEKLSVVASLENLMTFPFVASAVQAGTLSLHGLWTEIGEGGLEWYDPRDSGFHPV